VTAQEIATRLRSAGVLLWRGGIAVEHDEADEKPLDLEHLELLRLELASLIDPLPREEPSP